MELKHVVATISLLGLIYHSALAESTHCFKHRADMMLAASTQLLSRSAPTTCHPRWLNHILSSDNSDTESDRWSNRESDFQDVNYQPFTLSTRWTSALQHINQHILLNNNDGDELPTQNTAMVVDATSTKPWAAGIDGPNNRWLPGSDLQLWKLAGMGLG